MSAADQPQGNMPPPLDPPTSQHPADLVAKLKELVSRVNTMFEVGRINNTGARLHEIEQRLASLQARVLGASRNPPSQA